MKLPDDLAHEQGIAVTETVGNHLHAFDPPGHIEVQFAVLDMLLPGLASTGLHQLFKQWIDNGGK